MPEPNTISPTLIAAGRRAAGHEAPSDEVIERIFLAMRHQYWAEREVTQGQPGWTRAPDRE